MPVHDARDICATSVSADLCIIGAGAAGITLAHELADSGLRVALIESGGYRHSHRTQLLYRGRNTGQRSFSTVFSRFRRLGGSTTRWGGQCRPLDAIDFLDRPGIPHSGWPFSIDALMEHYRRAAQICHTGEFCDESSVDWLNALPDNFPADLFATPHYRFSHPANFADAYRHILEETPSIDVYLNANLVEIDVDAGGERIKGLALATLNRRRVRMDACAYVLACGGIENARLLLANRRVLRSGIGNGHDQVGRYFMDHPYLFPGRFEPQAAGLDPDLFTIVDYATAGREQRSHRGLALSESLRSSEGLNGASMYLLRRAHYKTQPEYTSPGGNALNLAIDVLRHREAPLPEVLRDIAALRHGVHDAAVTLARQSGFSGRARMVHALRVSLEQSPHPESRVTLQNSRDRLGMPRVDVHWRLQPRDLAGFRRLMSLLEHEFHARGLGSFVVHRRSDAEWSQSMTGGKHHIGTTRMHDDPRQGVVDANCQVHGICNLFIAGSSVFPTQGYANPTLTLVALACRLAGHLKQEFTARRFQ